MEAQISMNSSVGSSATAGMGKVTIASQSGKISANTAGEGSSFNSVLQDQMSDTRDQKLSPDNETLSLMALLQMMQQLLPQIVQGQTNSQDGAKESEQLPGLVLQVMNSNASLADELLKDPDLQQWLTQAASLLKVLSNDKGTPSQLPNIMVNALQTMDPNSAQVKNLQSQNTLLTLATMLKQQPENPILQYLAQDFSKVIKPLLSKLLESTLNVKVQAANPMAAETVDTVKTMETVDNGQKVTTELQMLANKSTVHIKSALDMIHHIDEPAEQTTESMNLTLPVTVVHDLQKMPQVESTVKAVPQALSANNFVQEMSQHALKNLKVTLAEGISEAKLSLFPRNLGHVDVKITMQNGQMMAQFAADTLAGKQMLESQLPQLRLALQSQGLQVDKLEVTQSQNMQSSMFQDQRHQQSSQQSFRQNKTGRAHYDQETGEFTQELISVSPAKNRNSGNSFDVTA